MSSGMYINEDRLRQIADPLEMVLLQHQYHGAGSRTIGDNSISGSAARNGHTLKYSIIVRHESRSSWGCNADIEVVIEMYENGKKIKDLCKFDVQSSKDAIHVLRTHIIPDLSKKIEEL